MIVYEEINYNDVITYGKERFNSNNHWINGVPPDDYKEVISSSNTHNWMSKFRNNYKTITITDNTDLNFLKSAYKVGIMTGKFSSLHREELNDFLIKYKQYDCIFDGTPYFIRTENVSLKSGQHGIGPYTNLKMIVESMTTSIHGHTPIYEDTTQIVLYLLPWINMDDKNEFRVFVHNNKITCISQQNCYENLRFEQHMLERFVSIIIDYFEKEIKNKMHVNSFSYDFVILENDVPYFIEMNCFGKEYAAGSSLFHWIIDEEKLYGHHGNITVRTIK